MTEERKKYLANISKKEREIRFALEVAIFLRKLAKHEIKYCWRLIEKMVLRNRINGLTQMIKALKKQLPAPKIPLELNGVVFPSTCSICKYPFAEANYCAVCGQKLR